MGPARFCSVLIVTAFQVMAQDATIQGQVSDESRAVIPHVSITVTNVETGISTDSQTNSSGLYSVPFLTLGVYRVRAAARGFTPVTQDNLRLDIGQIARIDFTLRIGPVTE